MTNISKALELLGQLQDTLDAMGVDYIVQFGALQQVVIKAGE